MSEVQLEATTPVWVPPGESVTVAGVEVSDGGLYRSAGVSASYASWMAEGRQDKAASPAHTEHFLLDIETRFFQILHRTGGVGARASGPIGSADAEALRAELRALADALASLAETYAHHQSCPERANRLLNFIRLGLLGERLTQLPAGLESGQANLVAARFGLAARVANGEQLDADWALCWLALEAHRRKEDKALNELVRFGWSFLARGLRERFAEKYPDGLLISRPDRCLAAIYQPIARRQKAITLRFPEMPGLAGHRDLRRAVEPIVEALQSELGPLVPRLRRASTPKARLRVLASLPEIPFTASGVAEAEGLRAHIRTLLGAAEQGSAVLEDVLKGWYDQVPTELDRAELRLLSSALDWVGVAMEPDPRLMGPGFKAETQVTLATRPVGSRHTPQYKAARTHMFAWSAVAWADGEIHASELQVLDEHLDAVFPGLDKEARARLSLLKAHLAQFQVEIPNWPRIIEPLEPAQKRTLGEFLVRVVLADGHAHEDELRETEALFERLGLDSGEVYVHLNRVQTGRDGQGRSVEEAAGEPAGEPKATAEPTEPVLSPDALQESTPTDSIALQANTTDETERATVPEPTPEPV